MAIKTQDREPECTKPHHDWFELGKEDNGAIASRCNTCLTVRLEARDGRVTYEVPVDEEGA